MKTHVVKKPVLPEDIGVYAYFPVHPSDVDYIKRQADGEIMQADIRKDRFYPLTKKYWALCNLIAENAKADPMFDFLDSKNIVDEYLKLRLGLIESRIVFPDGTVHVRTGSISNKAMDQDKFQSYYEQAVEIMAEVSGVSKTDIEDNWMEYECEVE